MLVVSNLLFSNRFDADFIPLHRRTIRHGPLGARRKTRPKTIQYVVTASPALERMFAELQDCQKSRSE
jgi:hypothetical protein